ncbi:Phosphotransferase system, phosphocarrier protein HPr [Desulforamulus reducens MI-1]|uniref:Phosphotransferase system, phosphocarrier protein HPr n=1 Tax=Desulforamulus reducens (strain ATCC BAA-1160 / DSM 100696 / MI-1) TaxID=349161 RepID=A4J904_DESRM|nr:HPr family phosphocarrier protein [Desulforamulus reducens]ABO51557.1 Phosphotransferase system, phosphocarrier protein HPr [Desulforamulus reducens MI-1]
MLKKDIKSFSKLDSHPAAEFVKAANQFHAEISLEKGGHRVNGKSIMGLMELANRNEGGVTLMAEGEDAPRALEVLGNLLENESSKQ